MRTTITFSDLLHTGHSCNSIPYGIGLVVSYALKLLGHRFEAKIFKHPHDLAESVEASPPAIACFSNYIWNSELACEMARRIKKKFPQTVIVFGGPNYPVDREEQKRFLVAHPYIDFYLFKDGEEALVELLKALFEYDFDIMKLKTDSLELPNCHFMTGEELVTGGLLPVIAELDDIPSPYLSGIFDPFLEEGLVPLTQTTRGCPFKCTFCQDGDDYANRVKRYSPQRISDELEYIAKRAKAPQLMWGDLNFGMYKQDLNTCRTIAGLREKYGWPMSVELNGKNQKERVLEAARIIDGDDLSGGAVTLAAAIQSTDPIVLKQVKRDNVSTEDMVGVANEGQAVGSSSFSEVILCLPGDTKEAHFKTIFDMMACEINVVRSHQFIMLMGSESASREDREKYQMVTRFRVTPRTVHPQRIFGDEFFAPEIDEICVANSTMSYQDYLDCRVFNLTVEIFFNYGVFKELLALLKAKGIAASQFITAIHERILSSFGPLTPLYDGFLKETEELFETREAMEDFLVQPGVKERYMDGELGNNEQMMYRALAIFDHMDILHRIAFETAEEMLEESGSWDDQQGEYLAELFDFCLLMKKDVLSVDDQIKKTFHYEFDKLNFCHFDADPWTFYKPEGTNIIFSHTDQQKKLINGYIKLFGRDNYGLGNILGSQAHVNNFYRRVETV